MPLPFLFRLETRVFMSTHAFLITVAIACVSWGPEVCASSEDSGLPASVNRVERETGGRVLSAERRNRGGHEVNRIKVYTPEGRVRVMWDDPRRESARPAQVPQHSAPRELPPREPRGQRARDDHR